MKNLIGGLLLSIISSLCAAQPLKPDWAFTVSDKFPPPSGNIPDPPDVFQSMPKIVQYGNPETQAHACGACHLPTGMGHDGSAYLAGLPSSYFLRQMADFRNGNRKGSATMIDIAKGITEEESRSAAEYYASLKPQTWIRVVETGIVPRTYIAGGNIRLPHPDGGTEPIGNRIIEVPEDEEFASDRDPDSGFVAYVPIGSLARGRDLVTTGGGGKTDPCALCHGETLHGSGDIPALAGRHPNYIVRQLWDFQNGERTGDSNEEMEFEVEDLTVDDMLAIAAYLGSLTP